MLPPHRAVMMRGQAGEVQLDFQIVQLLHIGFLDGQLTRISAHLWPSVTTLKLDHFTHAALLTMSSGLLRLQHLSLLRGAVDEQVDEVEDDPVQALQRLTARFQWTEKREKRSPMCMNSYAFPMDGEKRKEIAH
ncbi:hypothetical protein HaLaN_31457, partial [Haematococcus lacustris]